MHDYCYALDGETVDRVLVPAAEELWALCRDFAARAVRDDEILASLGIPAAIWDPLRDSWQRDGESALPCARFDLSFDGTGTPRLHECNIDVVGHVHEAALFQTRWFSRAKAAASLPPGARQLADLGPALAAALTEAARGRAITLLRMGRDPYDALTLLACEAVLSASGRPCRVVTADDPRQLLTEALPAAGDDFVLKLFRWDHFLRPDRAGVEDLLQRGRIASPLWSLLLSSKGCLPWLWRFNPGHPNLLAAQFDPAGFQTTGGYVSKPLFSIRGDDIEVTEGAAGPGPRHTQGSGGARHVYQALHYLPRIPGPTDAPWVSTGVFIVGGKARALTMTEADAPVLTGANGRTVPHNLL